LVKIGGDDDVDEGGVGENTIRADPCPLLGVKET
jgi:hypothetical protein